MPSHVGCFWGPCSCGVERVKGTCWVFHQKTVCKAGISLLFPDKYTQHLPRHIQKKYFSASENYQGLLENTLANSWWAQESSSDIPTSMFREHERQPRLDWALVLAEIGGMKPSHQPGEPEDPAAGLGIVNKDGPWGFLNSKIYSRLSAPGLEASALYPSIVRTNSGTGKLSLKLTIS